MRIMYHRTSAGWTARTYQPQCPAKVLFNECQGVTGHPGHHWTYRPDGSYAWSVNRDDPASVTEAGRSAGGWTPPDHKEWVSPELKHNEHYAGFFSDEKVTDSEIIKAIESEDYDILGDDVTIDAPVSEEELEWLREQGALEGLEDAEEDPEDV